MVDDDLETRQSGQVTDGVRAWPAPVTAPEDAIAALRAPLSRYVQSRVRDPHRVEDIVQETLLRMLQVRDRLEVDTLSAYAFTVARNLVYSTGRADLTARTHLSRLHDAREPERPEQAATATEARRALAAAIGQLPPGRRDLFVAHEVEERPLAELAAQRAVAPGTLASQLHRTRARLRVDYVLSLRRVTLPTRDCRPVLLAVSAGDRRAQLALGAGGHLATCPVCSDLAPPLVGRDRALAGLVPFVPLGAAHGLVERFLRSHPVAGPATAGASAAALVGAMALVWSVAQTPSPSAPSTAPVVAAAVATGGPDPTVAPPARAVPSTTAPPPTAAAQAVPNPVTVPGVTVAGRSVRGHAADLAPLAGHTVDADRVRVVSVPADEGFWVGAVGADGADHGRGDQVWVQLSGSGESPETIRPGQVLDFPAVVVANAPGFVEGLGISDEQGRSALRTAGYHLQAKASAVVVH